MSAKKIFISYSRRDTEYVSSLVEAMRKQGFEVWFDKNIRTGTDWDDTIESELKKADAIVLILSKTSVASENVKDEISYAIGLDKPVNPIKIEECEVPMRLARKQFVDFTVMGHEAGFERLVKDLKINFKEAETNVVKETFKPPKTAAGPSTTVAKGSKKIMPYILGGIGAIILFIVLLSQCDDGTATDSIQNVPTEENTAWQTAIKANTVNSYLGYIADYGPRDENYRAAQDSIDALMVYEGMVVYGSGTERYFVKNLYTDMTGTMIYAEDDNEIPKKYDIITALVPAQVYDIETFEALEGEILEPGEKARVISIRTDGDTVYIILYYPEM
jgi:hypothetical protein